MFEKTRGSRRTRLAVAIGTTCMGLLVVPATATAGEVYYQSNALDPGGPVIDVYTSYQSSVNWQDLAVDDNVKATLNSRGAVYEAHLMPVYPHPAAFEAAVHCTYVLDTATCRGNNGGEISAATLILGAGDDIGTLAGPMKGEIMAGPGDDILRGGPGDDLLRGDAQGGFECAIGSDRIWGGPGDDTASYDEEEACPSVKVTLDDVANDGAPGERDNVHSDVERLGGSAGGGDTLIGNDGPNIISGHGEIRGLGGADTLGARTVGPFPSRANSLLDGGDGPDRLQSTEKSDTLVGGAGEDELIGREGDDLIRAQDGERDAIDCGAGTDTVEADALDTVATNCENVELP